MLMTITEEDVMYTIMDDTLEPEARKMTNCSLMTLLAEHVPIPEVKF